MWIVTSFGFFSVVQKPQDAAAGVLTVRARVRRDLEELRARYLPELGDVVESRGTDYRYRGRAPRAAVAEALRRATLDVRYDNFKDEVDAAQGSARHEAYLGVWGDLLALQREEQMMWRPARGGRGG